MSALVRRYGRAGKAPAGPTEKELLDYFLNDADDIDVGHFSRSSTEAVARFFKIDEKLAYRRMNALMKKVPAFTKQRDTIFGGINPVTGKPTKSVGFQQWEIGWAELEAAIKALG